MSGQEYNYAEFVKETKSFTAFTSHKSQVGELAQSFPLEDFESGETVEMKELWKDGLVIMEWGSFT